MTDRERVLAGGDEFVDHDPDAYGAPATPEWWKQYVREPHPRDRSHVFRPIDSLRRDGEPLVLLHGVGNDGSVFGPIIPALSEFGPVVAPTLTAGIFTQGESDAVTALVDWLSDLAPPPWRLVGHSMGGVIAGLLMRIRPDVVSGAVLLNSPLPGVTGRIRRGDTLDRTGRALIVLKALAQVTALGRPRLPRLLRGPELLVVRQALRGFVDAPWRLDDRVISRAVMGSRTADGIDFLRLARGLPDWESAPFTARPVSIVLGATDPLVPLGDLAGVRSRYPHAEVRVVARVGHFVHLERSDTVLDAIGVAVAAPQPR
jgi:esterase